jgi:glycosyltransferase involved in cell wall biosynthesis
MRASKLTKLLIVGHSPLLTTGYGRVVRELASALAAAGHELTVLGLGQLNAPNAVPYRLATWADVRAIDDFVDALRLERPDVLITVGDPWVFQELPGMRSRHAEMQNLKWLAYFPVDGEPLPEAWKRWIAAVDVPVVFCNWTADLVEREMGRRPHVIPHGVDTRVFKPADKTHAKSRVGVSGAFVVGCVAANQQRKNLPALVKAFATFAKDKPDAMLYLHTQIDGYWDVEELVRHFGIEPKTRATLNLDPHRGVDDQTLATVYNAFDVFVLPTMAEGFGLPIIESQACGVPCLVTNYSACSELVPEPFNRLRVKDTLIMARNFEQAIVDEADIAAKLERLYAERAEAQRLGELGRQFVQKLAWDNVCAEFVRLIERAM